MRIRTWNALGLVVIASVASAIAQSKYSGIYNLSVGGKVILAITHGGHLLSLGNDTRISNEVNPSTSTVNANGKVIASSSNGLSVVANISSDFRITGTAKRDGETTRITGSRTLD